MANQWNNELIDIPDDEDEYYDPQDVKPVFNGRSFDGFANYQQQEDDGYFDDSRRHQLYWTTDATKTLIKLRGEREPDFEQAGASKSLLWIEICRNMRSLGYDFTAEKVSKKWHNIMITYNKNIRKKIETGVVNWGFFEDIDIYFKHKREQNPNLEEYASSESDNTNTVPASIHSAVANVVAAVPSLTIKRKIVDEQEESNYYNIQKTNNRSSSRNSIDRSIIEPQIEFKEFKKLKFNVDNMQTDVDPSLDEIDPSWWKEYFERRLELEKEKMRKEQERHKDNMNFQKMALMLQEKVEKIKVEAINNLTNAITKLAENKNKK